MDKRIDERFRKPRRTKGTPLYYQRNHWSLGVIAAGGLCWVLMDKPKPSTSKTESVSKYFKKMSQNSEAEVKTPKRNLDDSLDDDFKTPLALRKVDSAVWKLNKGPNIKSKSKKGKPSRNATIEIIKQNFSDGDNPDHLQMAIALSKSSYEAEYGKSVEESKSETPDVVSILQKVKSTDLERFGFKSNKACSRENRKASGEPTRRINSRFKYITPVLTIRTTEHRENLISAKISFILSQTGPYLIEKSHIALGTTLKKFQPDYSVFDYERIYDSGYFFVDDLRLPRSTHKCGFLLRNYNCIIGREPSPERTIDEHLIHEAESSPLNRPSDGAIIILDESTEGPFTEETGTSQEPPVINSKDNSPDLPVLSKTNNNFTTVTPNSSREPCLSTSTIGKKENIKETFLQKMGYSEKIESPPWSKKTLVSSKSKSCNSDVKHIGGSTQESMDSSGISADKNVLTSQSTETLLSENSNSWDSKAIDSGSTAQERMFPAVISADRKIVTSQSTVTLISQHSKSWDSQAKDSGISSTFRRSISPDLFGSDDEHDLNIGFNSPVISPNIQENDKQKEVEIIDDEKSSIMESKSQFRRPSFYNLDEFDDGVNLDEVHLSDESFCVNQLNEKYGNKKRFRLSGIKTIRENLTEEDTPCQTSSICHPLLEDKTISPNLEESEKKQLQEDQFHPTNVETSLNPDDVFLNRTIDLDKSTKSLPNLSLGDTILLDQVPFEDDVFEKNSEQTQSESRQHNLNYSPPLSPEVFGSSPPQYYEQPITSQCYESPKDTPYKPQRLSSLRPSNGYNSSEFEITDYLNSMLNKDQHSFDQDKANLSEKLCLSQEFQESVLADEELTYAMHFSTPAKAGNVSIAKSPEVDEIPKSPLALELDSSDEELPIENLVSTPDNYTIKTKNITPMPEYDNMSTPLIAKELEKVGVKPLKRARGAQFLRYIYENTHPLKGTRRVRKSDSDEEEAVIKRRKASLEIQQYEEPMVPLIEIVGDRLTRNERLEDLIFERRQSVKIPSCRVPLQIIWHNFLSCNPSIRENILLYEPLQLESLHLMLKELGFKFHVQDLMTFLDKKCIAIRTAQNQGRRKR